MPEGRSVSQVTLKTVFTVCFGALAVVALVYFLVKTQFSVILALGAALIAVALNHVVEALMRRGLRRKLAVLVVVFALLSIATGLSFLIIPPVVSQAKMFIATAPSLWQKLQQTRLFLFLDARFDLGAQLKQVVPAAAGAVTPVLAAIGGALSAVTAVVTLTLLAIFMLLFGGELIDSVLAEASPTNRDRYERVARKVYGSAGGYVGGVMAICSI